jgi:hypothetical protein
VGISSVRLGRKPAVSTHAGSGENSSADFRVTGWWAQEISALDIWEIPRGRRTVMDTLDMFSAWELLCGYLECPVAQLSGVTTGKFCADNQSVQLLRELVRTAGVSRC